MHPKYLFSLIFLLAFIGCQSPVSTPEVDLVELTISDIHKAYNAGTFNAHDLVNAYLDRIEALDEQLNALTYINPEAITIALELDEEFQSTGKLRPLHGIPLIVKDNINTKGMPTTAGSLALKDYIPKENAFIIQRLVDAGAIILAKSNMAEWAFSPRHTESSTAGTTHNPYDLERVPAGSSGGTAASIAANLGTIGLGTDTGNSIRGPSSHCALVGFRTTLGLISRSAIVPLYLRNDVVGPMCRTVEDATRVMEVIAGYDPTDPLTQYSEGIIPSSYTNYLDKEGLKDARIGVLRLLTEDIDPEILRLFEQAIVDLDSLGATVVDSVQVPNFEELRQGQWCAEFEHDLEEFLHTYVQSDTLKLLEAIIRVGTNSEYAAKGLENALGESGRYGNDKTACGDPFTDIRRIAYREAIESVMDSLNLDALIYPSWKYPPAHIDAFMEEYKGDNSQIIAPHTGQPAFTVPMGFTEDGLPTGLQILGRMFDEPTLIRLTYAYEQGTMHRRTPQEF